MLYLNIGSQSDIIVTLQERTTNYVNPFYVWDIEGSDHIHYQFCSDDISTRPWYYNEFLLTVIPGATYGATAGIISADQGQYYYTVYLTDQYNLNIASASNVVETGIMNIIGTYSQRAQYTTNKTQPMTYKNLIKL